MYVHISGGDVVYSLSVSQWFVFTSAHGR